MKQARDQRSDAVNATAHVDRMRAMVDAFRDIPPHQCVRVLELADRATAIETSLVRCLRIMRASQSRSPDPAQEVRDCEAFWNK